MNTTDDATDTPAIEIRFGQVGLVQVRLNTLDPGAVLDELTGRTVTAPHFFERTAACLDLTALGKVPAAAEVRALVQVIRRAGMLAVGLAEGPVWVEPLARELDMPVFMHVRVADQPVPVVQAVPQPAIAWGNARISEEARDTS